MTINSVLQNSFLHFSESPGPRGTFSKHHLRCVQIQ